MARKHDPEAIRAALRDAIATGNLTRKTATWNQVDPFLAEILEARYDHGASWTKIAAFLKGFGIGISDEHLRSRINPYTAEIESAQQRGLAWPKIGEMVRDRLAHKDGATATPPTSPTSPTNSNHANARSVDTDDKKPKRKRATKTTDAPRSATPPSSPTTTDLAIATGSATTTTGATYPENGATPNEHQAQQPQQERQLSQVTQGETGATTPANVIPLRQEGQQGGAGSAPPKPGFDPLAHRRTL